LPIALGVDHICGTSADLVHDTEAFHGLGFTTLFAEPALPVPAEKLPFLRRPTATQAAVFLKSERGVAVELMQHGAPEPNPEASGPYVPVFGASNGSRSVVGHTGRMGPVFEAALKCNVTFENTPLARYQVAGAGDRARPGLMAVAVECADMSASLAFWRDGLGFAPVGEPSSSWRLLQLKAPLSTWSCLLLLTQAGSRGGKSFLDDAGWTCLSVITSRAAESLARVQSTASELGELFELHVGGNRLRIAFVRGPDAELVELIEFLV
jgi:hypothetical protein